MVSALYAALLALIQVALTMNVVRYRMAQSVSLGTERGNSELMRAVRAHGNFIEIVPISLILLMLGDLQGAPHWCLHSLGILIVVGRAFHIYAILKCPNSVGLPRGIGMVMNLFSLILGALLNLWLSLPAL